MIVTVPSILVDIASSGQEAIQRLAKYVQMSMSGGAPLPPNIGDQLSAAGANIVVEYGM